MSTTEKAELARRLQEIEDNERAEFLVHAESVWSSYLLPVLTKSRQQNTGSTAPVQLTLRHRQGAYRSGLQGGGVWILRWGSYREYMNCTGDAQPETFGFKSLDDLMPSAEHQLAITAALPKLGVEFSIEFATQTHPLLTSIQAKCTEIQTACRALSLRGGSFLSTQLGQVDWEGLKARLRLDHVIVNKVHLREKLRDLTALIEALPSAPTEAKAPTTATADPVALEGESKRGIKRVKQQVQ